MRPQFCLMGWGFSKMCFPGGKLRRPLREVAVTWKKGEPGAWKMVPGMGLSYHFCPPDVCLVLLKLAWNHAGCFLLLSVWYC